MKSNNNQRMSTLEGVREKIISSLSSNGIVILPPMDIMVSSRLLRDFQT
jgi:hypothetical protein